MAGIIKKQILKHLSKFAKNLSADKINLSTFRGEGELNNLELDCIALQNVMNLPTWLQINRANCNRVHVKIPWTNLKKSPICIFLDAVDVEMVTCERPRQPNGPSPIQASASGGDTSYGFTEKVLEGMTVTINSISVNFTSAAFNANFQLSQLSVVSTNPNWEASDLRFSRIQDKTIGQVLTFKKMSWQTMRLVANAVTTSDKSTITPLRLITNQSEIKMTFRRKTSDCSVLASRVHIHFDDLLWVLTDSQVQSALLCVKSLRDAIERSSQQMRELGLDKSHEAAQPQPKPPTSAKADSDDQQSSKYFHQYTVIESAIHLDFDRVDLHVCEETSPVHRASATSGIQGGAIQISLHDLKVDHYPYHKPASDRHHFRGYGETMIERDSWAEGIIKQFRNDFANLKKAADKAGNLITNNINRKPARLVENCLVVRLTDIDIHQVTTSNSKKQSGGRLINSTRKELHLPDDMPLFYFIRTEYYYPDGRDFPAPHDNIFMQLNAPQIHAHWDSLIWLNRLSTVTVQAVQKMLEDLGILSEIDEEDMDVSESNDKDEEHTDIRIQVLMPKIFIPGPTSAHSKQPHGLEVQVSKAAVTNCREGTDCTRTQLKNILNNMEEQHLTKKSSSFPSDGEIDMPPLQKLLKTHASGADKPLEISIASGSPVLTRNSLMAKAKSDVWSVDLDNIWIDFVMPNQKDSEGEQDEPTGGFLGLSKSCDPLSSGIRFPFIDSFPAQLWIGKSTVAYDGLPKIATQILIPEKGPVLSPSNSVSNVPQSSAPDFNLSGSEYAKANGDIRRPHHDPPVVSDLAEQKTWSPRTMRNKKLTEYYQSPLESDAVSHDRVSIASTSSVRNKVSSTYILLHTDKSLRLQLDHHQYLHLLHLIDMLEAVEDKMDESTKETLSSTPSSVPSTPSHTSKTSGVSSPRAKKVMETSSIRISAPSADLFLILRPPPPDVRSDDVEEKSISESSTSSAKSPTASSATKESSLSSNSVKSQSLSVDDVPISATEKVAPKIPLSVQDTPPLSDCGSDTLSMQGSDSFSMFGDSSSTQGSAYPHYDVCLPSVSQNSPAGRSQYPHDTSDNEDLPLLPQDPNSSAISLPESPAMKAETPQIRDAKLSFSKQKSGSFSVLSSTSSTVSSKLTHKILHRNLSTDNLRVSMSTSDQKLSITDVAVSKSGSSGYESGSRESLPIPQNLENIKQSKPDHSRSSSDASDQFVMIQVDKKGRGTDDFATVKLSKQQKASSISSGVASETSSLSSQSLPATEPSKSDVTEETLSACPAMVDSQITVTNIETESICSSVTTDKESDAKKEEAPAKEPEMCSLALLHVSNGVELGIDSNEIGDSLVKIVAHTAMVAELGTRQAEKNDSIFVNYPPKKCGALFKKDVITPLKGPPNVCLRVDSGPLASRFTPAAVKFGHIQLSADGVALCLKSSTLANLGAYLEDDVQPDIVPMIIEASDVKLTINDDMPAAYEATPPSDPITLHVHSATVKRTDDGTFHVNTSTSGQRLSLPKAQSLSSLSEEKRVVSPISVTNPVGKLGEMDKTGSVTNSDLVLEPSGYVKKDETKSEEDSEKLRLQKEVEELRKKLADVESHRDALHDVLERMQEDLLSSERGRSNLRAQFSQ